MPFDLMVISQRDVIINTKAANKMVSSSPCHSSSEWREYPCLRILVHRRKYPYRPISEPYPTSIGSS